MQSEARVWNSERPLELSRQDSPAQSDHRDSNGWLSRCDQWGLDPNQLVRKDKKCPKAAVLELIKHELRWGKKPSQHWHLSYSRSEVWHCIQSAKLPAKHPDPHLLFSTVHEVPFTLVKSIYFPTVSFWVMSPIPSASSEETQHNLEQKDNKSPELLVRILTLYESGTFFFLFLQTNFFLPLMIFCMP